MHALTDTFAIVKALDGTAVQETIHCQLDFGQGETLSASGSERSEYWRKIELLIRKFGPDMSSDSSDHATVSYSRTGALLQEITTGGEEKIVDKSRSSNEQTTTRAAPLKTLLRTAFKLDPDQGKLHAEIDFVPGVKGSTALSALILRKLGPVPPNLSNDRFLRNLKTLLVGLTVIRTYKPVSSSILEKSVQITGTSHTHGPMASSPKSISTAMMSSSFPESIIVDPEPASRVPNFWKNNKRYTVTRYLLESE